jgi:predicted RNA binding protein YcfA (HicA-like mRNA interferase family)
MKVPRGISADRLTKALEQLGYAVRQKGSHVRMQHPGPPSHSVTVPRHKSLKIGTLHSILAEVAEKRSVTVDSIVDLL